MCRLQGRIASQDFVFSGTLCETIKNHSHRNSSANSTDLSPADVRFALEKVLPSDHASILSGFFRRNHADLSSRPPTSTPLRLHDPWSAIPPSAPLRGAPHQSHQPHTESRHHYLRAQIQLSPPASNRFPRAAFPDLPSAPRPD